MDEIQQHTLEIYRQKYYEYKTKPVGFPLGKILLDLHFLKARLIEELEVDRGKIDRLEEAVANMADFELQMQKKYN